MKDVAAAVFADTLKEAKLPVLVDFHAAWCAPCRALAPVVEQISKDYADRISVMGIDADTSPSILQQFHVRSLPTLMLFKGQQPVRTIIGMTSTGTLKACLDEYLECADI